MYPFWVKPPAREIASTRPILSMMLTTPGWLTSPRTNTLRLPMESDGMKIRSPFDSHGSSVSSPWNTARNRFSSRRSPVGRMNWIRMTSASWAGPPCADRNDTSRVGPSRAQFPGPLSARAVVFTSPIRLTRCPAYLVIRSSMWVSL